MQVREHKEEFKRCEFCGRPLPVDYEQDCCPSCIDYKLFHEVKEYIRDNDVNEYQVAEHFRIPLRRVKEWIREGRIEYRAAGEGNITSVRCQRCGAPVSFGSLCAKCLKLLNSNHGYAIRKDPSQSSDGSRMHYLDEDNKNT